MLRAARSAEDGRQRDRTREEMAEETAEGGCSAVPERPYRHSIPIGLFNALRNAQGVATPPATAGWEPMAPGFNALRNAQGVATRSAASTPARRRDAVSMRSVTRRVLQLEPTGNAVVDLAQVSMRSVTRRVLQPGARHDVRTRTRTHVSMRSVTRRVLQRPIPRPPTSALSRGFNALRNAQGVATPSRCSRVPRPRPRFNALRNAQGVATRCKMLLAGGWSNAVSMRSVTRRVLQHQRVEAGGRPGVSMRSVTRRVLQREPGSEPEGQGHEVSMRSVTRRVLQRTVFAPGGIIQLFQCAP